jgi:hypothetical protein
MIKLGEKYGISANGLKKICIKLNVPFPSVGYWAKIKAGYKQKIPPLPTITYDQIVEYKLQLQEKVDYSIDQKYQSLIDNENDQKSSINIPKTLSNPHSLILLTKSVMENEQVDRYGFIPRFRRQALSISVTPKNWKRALKIFNTLIINLEKRNFKIQIIKNYYDRYETHVYFDNICIEIELREELKIKKEKIQKSDYRFGYYNNEYSYIPTGRLKFEIKSRSVPYIKKYIIDNERLLIEDQLNNFIIYLYQILNFKTIQKRLDEEEEAKREVERKALQQKQQLKQQEIENTKKLFDMAEDWDKILKVKQFIDAYENYHIENKSLDDDKIEWIKWARSKADENNPLIKKDTKSEINIEK